MNNIYYYLDVFKAPLTYNVNGKPSFSSKFGFLVTLPIIIFLAISFFRSDLILKEHPTISSQQVAGTGRPYLKFDKSNMTFAMRLADDNGVGFLDETYFSVQIYNVIVNNTSNEVISLTNKKTKICDETDFKNPNYLKDYGIKNSICAENDTYNIGGYWTEPFVSYVRVLLVPCKNGTNSNIVCKSQEQIKNYFKNKYFCLYYNDVNFDLVNYEKSIQPHYDVTYQMTDASIRKRMTMFYKKVDYISDEGFFFMDNTIQNFFVFDKMESDFTMDSSDYVFEIMIYSSMDVQVMVRRYLKIQDVCASLGGIGSVLMFFGLLIVLFEKDFNLRKCVLNELYSFPAKKKDLLLENSQKKNDGIKKGLESSVAVSEKTTAIKKEKVKTIQIATLDTKLENLESQNTKKNFIFPKVLVDDIPPSLKSFENEEKIVSKNTETIFEKDLVLVDMNDSMKISDVLDKRKFPLSPKTRKSIFREKEDVLKKFESFAEFRQKESKKQRLNISFRDYMKYELSGICKCLKRNHNQKLFHKASKLVLKETDFFNVLKRIQEIDKLKLILLSSEQLQLFNLLSKPMIFEEDLLSDAHKEFDGFKMSVMLENTQIGKKENINTILDYYKKIKANKGNDVDNRLMKLIDNSFEQFINFHKKQEDLR